MGPQTQIEKRQYPLHDSYSKMSAEILAIEELEAQIAAIKQQQEGHVVDAAMTPRGGGANAVRALRKENANSTAEDVDANIVTAAATAATDETTTATTATTTTEPTNADRAEDDLDLQLYANNGFFPPYVEKVSENTTIQKKECVVVQGPPNWASKKTPGKFGKVYWVNTVTGRDYYNEQPPTPELLEQWEKEAAILIKEGEEEQKRQMAKLAAESAETERLWQAKIAAERSEADRLQKEFETEQAAKAASIPPWKQRLLDRKAKKAAAAAAAASTTTTTTTGIRTFATKHNVLARHKVMVFTATVAVAVVHQQQWWRSRGSQGDPVGDSP